MEFLIINCPLPYHCGTSEPHLEEIATGRRDCRRQVSVVEYMNPTGLTRALSTQKVGVSSTYLLMTYRLPVSCSEISSSSRQHRCSLSEPTHAFFGSNYPIIITDRSDKSVSISTQPTVFLTYQEQLTFAVA